MVIAPFQVQNVAKSAHCLTWRPSRGVAQVVQAEVGAGTCLSGQRCEEPEGEGQVCPGNAEDMPQAAKAPPDSGEEGKVLKEGVQS